MLTVKNLKVQVGNKHILNGVNIDIQKGEICVVMGKNGSGKSTLAQSIMGNPQYKITEGSVEFAGKDITRISSDEKSKLGIFVSFQNPVEIPGVSVFSYLRMIYNIHHTETLSPLKFREFAKEISFKIHSDEKFFSRYLNEGFSGGEKKKMEILQMMCIEPKLAILDEIDSGLDVDALKNISDGIKYLKEKTGLTLVLITHYSRILKYTRPDRVFIMENGAITKEGTADLAEKVEVLCKDLNRENS